MVPSTVDTLHELLATDRRRDALAVLAESGRPLTRRELARRTVTRKRGDPWTPDDHPDRPVDRVEVELRHCHLPPLLDAGVVTRSESDRFAATESGRDLHRAGRAFRAVVGDVGETRCVSSANRTQSDGPTEGSDADERLVLSVSWDAVEAVDNLVESDERWTSHPGYDEAIRTAVLEASE